MSQPPPHMQPSEAGKSTDLLVGRTIGDKYALEKVLGAGAMGAVYLARHVTLDKNVAVKVMHRGLLADPTFAARFHREAKAASKLDHPNSIRIVDFGEDPDGLLYIVMDYLDGRDLLRVIHEDWPLPPARTANILAQVLSALAVAHEMGVLHRDLKPENIMVLRHVSDDGTPIDVVKVCDFGIAKISEGRDAEPHASGAHAKLSTGGMLVGTPAYMSPEQAQGEPLDARSDLYSVGVILYQVLTMCLPFEAASAVGLLLKHVHEKPPPPSSLSSGVHPGLEAVCLKAMAKQRRDRYPNAREMRTALRAAVDAALRSERSDQSPGPVLVSLSKRPVNHANANMPTLASVPSVRPGVASMQAPEGPRARRALWIGGAALVIAASAFLLPRWRSHAPSSAAQGLISPTPAATPTATALPSTEGTAAPPRASTPVVTVVAATSTARKNAKSKGSLDSPPAPRNEVVVAPAPSAAAPAVEPPPVAETPVVAPPPDPPAPQIAPAAPPPPIVPAAQPPAAPPPMSVVPLDPKRAHVEVGMATATTGTTAYNVNKTLAPLGAKITACYRSALGHLHEASDEASFLHLETNEDGIITEAHLGSPIMTEAAPCIVAAVRGRRISNVDTGSARADVPLAFKVR